MYWYVSVIERVDLQDGYWHKLLGQDPTFKGRLSCQIIKHFVWTRTKSVAGEKSVTNKSFLLYHKIHNATAIT